MNLETIPSSDHLDILKTVSNIQCVFICNEEVNRLELQEKATSGSRFIVRNLGVTIDMFLHDILHEHNKHPYQAVYITGNIDEIRPVIQAGIPAVLFTNREAHVSHTDLPDYVVYDAKGLEQCLNGSAFGYYGEMRAQGAYGTGFFRYFELEHKLHPDVKALCLITGRYFTSSDRRAPIHPLTQKILGLKRGKYIEQMGDLLAESIEVFTRSNKIDLITAVPPRPGEKSRHIPVLHAAAKSFPKTIDLSLIDTTVLRTVRNYPSQKTAGGFVQRFMNVAGVFATTRQVSGNVVIFDDVITSGATALECARMLYKAGADTVAIVAYAASQTKVEAGKPRQLPCKNDSCNGYYQLRFNRQDGSAFFGCSNYPLCKSMMSYELGRREYNSSVVLSDGDDTSTSWL